MKSKSEEKEKMTLPPFFAVSCIRLYVLSVLSFGFYELYWMYKNWQAIKNHQEKPSDAGIYPFWRSSVFFMIWIFPLLWRMMKIYGKVTTGYMLAAVLYTFGCFLVFCADNALVTLVLWLIAPLLMLPLQRLINAHNPVLKKVSGGEIGIVIGGLLIGALYPVISYMSRWSAVSALDAHQKKSFFAVSGLIYRYSDGYTEACAAQGQSLDNYNRSLNQALTEEKGVIGRILKRSGLSFDEFMNIMLNDEVKQEMIDSVTEDLENIRKFFILQMLKDSGDLPPDDRNWKDEYNNLLSLKETCELIDQNADFVINFTGIKKSLNTFMNDL